MVLNESSVFQEDSYPVNPELHVRCLRRWRHLLANTEAAPHQTHNIEGLSQRHLSKATYNKYICQKKRSGGERKRDRARETHRERSEVQFPPAPKLQ